MITEIAYLTIDPARATEFELAVAEAAAEFRAAKGCHAMQLQRTIENPAEYRLIVGWESVEAHMVDFRNSPAFVRWRALASPFFVIPPKVEHTEQISSYF